MKCTLLVLSLLPLASTAMYIMRSPVVWTGDSMGSVDMSRRDPLTGAFYDPRDRSSRIEDSTMMIMNGGNVLPNAGVLGTNYGVNGFRPSSMLRRSPLTAHSMDSMDVWRRDPLTGAFYDPRDRSSRIEDSTMMIMNGGNVLPNAGVLGTTYGMTGIKPGSMLSRFPLKAPLLSPMQYVYSV